MQEGWGKAAWREHETAFISGPEEFGPRRKILLDLMVSQVLRTSKISLSQRKGIRRAMNIYITWLYLTGDVPQSLKPPPRVLKSLENPFQPHLEDPAEFP